MTAQLTVTKGVPDDTELAAVLAVLAVLCSDPTPSTDEGDLVVPWRRGGAPYAPPGMWSSR